jgi:Glycosyl hydrolase family 26
VAALLMLAVLGMPGSAAAKPRPLYWGAWIGPQLTGEEAPWDMDAATQFEERVGRGLSLIEFSAPFAQCEPTCHLNPFPLTPLEQIRLHGAIPLFSWNSGAGGGGDQAKFGLAELRAGRYDRYIRYFARSAKAWGWPFFLRFDWEMNGSWFPWGAGVNDNEPGEFVLAWRHVHRIFEEEGATNVSWVWCPFVGTGLRQFYPGDRYVDWTGLDGYNWGPESTVAAPWQTFNQLFASSYRQVARIAPSKPMMVGEVASTGNDEQKAVWIREMFAALRRGYPKVHGLVWFDKVDRETQWPVETLPGPAAAFAEGLGRGFKQSIYSHLKRSPIPPPQG